MRTGCLSQNVMQEEWEIYRYVRMSQNVMRGWEIGTSGNVNSAVNMERNVRNMSSKKRRPAVAEAEKSTHTLTRTYPSSSGKEQGRHNQSGTCCTLPLCSTLRGKFLYGKAVRVRFIGTFSTVTGEIQSGQTNLKDDGDGCRITDGGSKGMMVTTIECQCCLTVKTFECQCCPTTKAIGYLCCVTVRTTECLCCLT